MKQIQFFALLLLAAIVASCSSSSEKQEEAQPKQSIANQEKTEALYDLFLAFNQEYARVDSVAMDTQVADLFHDSKDVAAFQTLMMNQFDFDFDQMQRIYIKLIQGDTVEEWLNTFSKIGF